MYEAQRVTIPSIRKGLDYSGGSLPNVARYPMEPIDIANLHVNLLCLAIGSGPTWSALLTSPRDPTF